MPSGGYCLNVTAAPTTWSCVRRRCAPSAPPRATCKPGRFAAEAGSRFVAAGRNRAARAGASGRARFHRRRAGNKSSRKFRRERGTRAKSAAQGFRSTKQKPMTGRNMARLKKTILAPRRMPCFRSEGPPLRSSFVCGAFNAPAGAPSRAIRSATPSRRKPQLGQNLTRSEAG